MNLLNHIPFGLREEDQKYVDVADVPRGRACACICPSCNIKLIARQGNINRWHFAHAGRKTESPDNGCEYSFFVSVRAMAKQIIESGSQLSTPGCWGSVSDHRYGILYSESFYATKPCTVTLGNIQKECLFEETMVDICGEVNGFPLVIYFSHPDRSVPSALEQPSNTRCGILEVDLTSTRDLFLSKKARFDRFGDEIRTFIESCNRAKRWIYHPRKSMEMSKARSNLEKQLMTLVPPQQRKLIRENPYVRFVRGGNQHYECVMCKNRWSGFENEKQVCPDCQQHLYVRQI